MIVLNVVTDWPPKRSGSSLYSLKLYTQIARYAKVHIVTAGPASEIGGGARNGALQVHGVRASGILAPLLVALRSLRLPAHLFHVQYEYSTLDVPIGGPLIIFLLSLVRLSGKPLIITLHGIMDRRTIRTLSGVKPDNPYLTLLQFLGPLGFGLVKLAIKLMCSASNKIIVHNRLMGKVLASEFGIKPEKIVVIPHGVDKLILPDRRRPNAFQMLFFGYLRPSKGLETLLKAMSIVVKERPWIRLVMAGGPPHQQRIPSYSNEIRDLINKMGLANHVTLISGFIPEKRLNELISSSDAIVLPYVDAFIEASGVLCRVMDSSRPVICTRVPRFTGELEEGVDCLMVDPGDEVGLARAIVRVAEDPSLGERIGKNLKLKARARYWERVALHHIKLYLEVLGHENCLLPPL